MNSALLCFMYKIRRIEVRPTDISRQQVGKDAYVDEYRQRIMELNGQRKDYGNLSENMKTSHLFKLQLIKKFMLLQNLFCTI